MKKPNDKVINNNANTIVAFNKYNLLNINFFFDKSS